MKISLTVTVDLPNPQEWSDTYGRGDSAKEIREDVKEHIGNAVQQIAPFGTGEVQARVTWK
jgi:hypothetical protein